jgi:hypothetical protein
MLSTWLGCGIAMAYTTLVLSIGLPTTCTLLPMAVAALVYINTSDAMTKIRAMVFIYI